jgi:hypothetical protein
MKRILVALLLFLSSCTPRGPHALDGTPVPDVLAAYPAVRQITVAWYASCPWCKKELQALADDYWNLRRGVVEVIALNYGDPDDVVAETVAERAYPFPVIAGYQLKDLPAVGVPFSRLYCRGELISQQVGYMSLRDIAGILFLECK